MIFLFLIAAVVLLDLGLKDTIDEMDQEQFPKELEGSRGWILLYRNHNEGFPFGALKEKQELVKMIPLAVVSAAAGILCWILPRKGQNVEKIGLSMAIGEWIKTNLPQTCSRFPPSHMDCCIYHRSSCTPPGFRAAPGHFRYRRTTPECRPSPVCSHIPPPDHSRRDPDQ